MPRSTKCISFVTFLSLPFSRVVVPKRLESRPLEPVALDDVQPHEALAVEDELAEERPRLRGGRVPGVPPGWQFNRIKNSPKNLSKMA